jgi:hypothetical protein
VTYVWYFNISFDKSSTSYFTQFLASGESVVAFALFICPLKSILSLLHRFWSELFFRVPDVFFFKNKNKKEIMQAQIYISLLFSPATDLSAQGIWLETQNGVEIHATQCSSSAIMWKIMVLLFLFSKHWVTFLASFVFVSLERKISLYFLLNVWIGS